MAAEKQEELLLHNIIDMNEINVKQKEGYCSVTFIHDLNYYAITRVPEYHIVTVVPFFVMDKQIGMNKVV